MGRSQRKLKICFSKDKEIVPLFPVTDILNIFKINVWT